MSEKNLETTKKNEVVGEATMSKEQKEKFVNENLSYVPRNCCRKFELLPLDEQVKKIRYYINTQKAKAEMAEKNKLENKVKDLFIKRKATTQDVVRVIEFCKRFIQATKEEEINKLDVEIKRLTSLKQTLEAN